MKSHVPLETGNPGRPLTDSTPASGHIHLRVTMERKNRYVRAARKRKMKLSEWMTETCDTASWLRQVLPSLPGASHGFPAK
jgi:hypothetical protein